MPNLPQRRCEPRRRGRQARGDALLAGSGTILIRSPDLAICRKHSYIDLEDRRSGHTPRTVNNCRSVGWGSCGEVCGARCRAGVELGQVSALRPSGVGPSVCEGVWF